MESNAQAYDVVSKPQIESSSQFIRELNLSVADKVLDMGCGTGIVSKYIADIVGSAGQVIGIDPDIARIDIAKEKREELDNLEFHVGSSVTGFPHDNEPYYDVHISTWAYHWLSEDEKRLYVQKAYQCLKPGGRLAILCTEKLDDTGAKKKVPGYNPLSQDGYRKVFQEVGLFVDVVVERNMYAMSFKSYEELEIWFKASSHEDKPDPANVNRYVTEKEDGSVTALAPLCFMTACKK